MVIFLLTTIIAVITINNNIRTFDFFRYGASLNIVLFLLNMLPLPILDGATVWGYLLPMPSSIKRINPELKNGILVFLFFTIFYFSGVLWSIGYFITHKLMKLLIMIFY